MSKVIVSQKKNKRHQITFNKDSTINKRIESLLKKFDGMELSEITKLALINLDNTTDLFGGREPDEKELKAIMEFEQNPEILSIKQSQDLVKKLKKKAS